MRHLFSHGFTLKEIHEKTGIPKRTLHQWVKDLAGHRRSMRNAAIMEMARQGMSHEQIAEKVGLSRRAVDYVVKGRRKDRNSQDANIGKRHLSDSDN